MTAKRVHKLVDARDDYSCVRCGLSLYSVAGSRHHRQLRSQGGKDTVQNLILLCGSGTTGCHGWVHAHPKKAKETGFIVPSWGDPSSIPFTDLAGVTFWLDDDGNKETDDFKELE